MLTDNTFYIFESKGIRISERDNLDGTEYARTIEISLPVGADFSQTIYYNGTDEDFIREFCKIAKKFNHDDYTAELIPDRGTLGIPNSIRTILDNAEAIKRTLLAASEELYFSVPQEYTVPVYIQGTVDIKVIASTVEEALEEAESIARKGNYGSLYDLEFSAEAAIDNNGNIYQG